MTDLYADLDVPRDADAAAIKRAYRRKAKATHPDAGGDGGAFSAAADAYRVLSDPRLRDHYDRTGETPGVENRTAAIVTLIQQKLLQILAQCDVRLTDIPATMIQMLEADAQQIEAQRRKITKDSGRLLEALRRIRHKGKSQDLIGGILNEQIKMLTSADSQMAKSAALITAAIEHLRDYGYEIENVPKSHYNTAFGQTSTTGRR